MKKINIEKLLKKIKVRKNLTVINREAMINYERLELPINPCIEEMFPRIQRK